MVRCHRATSGQPHGGGVTSRQFNKALMLLGITQIDLSRAIDVNERTIRSWVGGRSKVPNTVAALLNLLIDTKASLKDIRI